jgi:hypothetical protein
MSLFNVLTREMAKELAEELEGLQSSAADPEQYTAKISALRAIERGFCRVRRAPITVIRSMAKEATQ